MIQDMTSSGAGVRESGRDRQMGDVPRVLCLLPRMNDSRIARRIDMLGKAGFSIEALAFEREQDLGRRPDCFLSSLGSVRHGRYLSRMPGLIRAIPKVRRAIRRADIVYAFNADMALLALLGGARLGRPVVQETADIRNVQVSRGIAGILARTLERQVVERCSLLVLTAEGYREFYRDWVGFRRDCLVIENKVDAGFAASVKNGRQGSAAGRDKKIRIGWFGMLRDEWSWNVLRFAIESWPDDYVAVLAGVGSLRRFERRVVEHPGVEYLGEYENPADLCRIYDSIDLVMACYPSHIPHSWSRSNRYYEACLFRKPLIVRSGCADAEHVARRDIGLVLGSVRVEAAARELHLASDSDISRWQHNIGRIPLSDYAATEEADILRDAIVNALAERRWRASAHCSDSKKKTRKRFW